MMAAPALPKIARGDMTKDLDLAPDELFALLDLAKDVKHSPQLYRSALAGKSIVLLFEKPSLRTRLTFELAIQQLGGFSLLNEGRIGEREPLKDMARNLDRWVSAIVARTFLQKTVDGLAHWSRVPVINALSDAYHPCQALADMQTVREHFGSARGVKFAFVGDGNNMAHSLMLNAARLGMDFALATPERYEASAEVIAQARDIATGTGSRILITHDPAEAARRSNVIYTDVWTSMGEENEAAERRTAFADYQVDDELFSHAEPGALFMHCLPARRGEEVTGNVIESSRSVVFDQAENRLHVQKALLLMLLDERTGDSPLCAGKR
ncbi:MAG TPA: ornithine carbamoyltransferase [Bryobacteraceae bacterium]|jgi:ornithine carbamoyltransferase|nr:ornithine carbamoyltransferase [Bryobacteraceae bacterium]